MEGNIMEDTKSLATLIKAITNEYEKYYNKQVATIGLTTAQCEVLNYLFETNKEYVHQIDLEKHLSLSNPTVTGLLKRLDEKGYVLIVQNNGDKRKKNIHLTESAYKMQKRIRSCRKKANNRLVLGMPRKEQQKLASVLEGLLENIE